MSCCSVVRNFDRSALQRRRSQVSIGSGRWLPRRSKQRIHLQFRRRTHSFDKLECISLHNSGELSSGDQVRLITHDNTTEVRNVFVPQWRPVLELVPPFRERFEGLGFVDVVHQHHRIRPAKECGRQTREPFLASSVLLTPYRRTQFYPDLRSRDQTMTHPYL